VTNAYIVCVEGDVCYCYGLLRGTGQWRGVNGKWGVTGQWRGVNGKWEE